MAGTARIAMRNHGNAVSAMPPPEPAMAVSNTGASASTTTTMSTPRASASHVACTPSPTAPARSRAPKLRADRDVVPYDRKVSCEPTRLRINPPTARPASGSAPNRPTTAVSSRR